MTKHNLRYDITDLKPDENILDKYPELAVYPEFQGSDQRWLKYVIYSQDIGSGFLRIKDLEKRKEEALKAAGFTYKNGSWSDERCNKVLLSEDDVVLAMESRYLRSIMRNIKYAFYVSLEEMVWRNTMKIRRPVEELEVAETSAEENAKGKRKVEAKETDVLKSYQLQGILAVDLPKHIESLGKLGEEIFMNDEKLRRFVATQEEGIKDEESVEAMIQRLNGKP